MAKPKFGLVVRVNPVPASRPRVTRRGATYYGEPYRTFKDEFPAAVRKVTNGLLMILVPVRLVVAVYVAKPKKTVLPHPRPDVDNYLKAVMDGLNGIVWKDDSQVREATITKSWTDGSPRIEITIEPL